MEHHEVIEIRHSRIASAIGAIPFAILTSVLVDALFVGRLNVGKLGQGIVEWSLLFAFGIGLLWCLKTALWPSLMFRCDRDGITVGRGVIVNRTQLVPWSQVVDVCESAMSVFVEQQTRRVGEARISALRVQVDESVDLGNTGFRNAYPKTPHDFRIAAKLFSLPLADMVQILNQMKAKYSATSK